MQAGIFTGYFSYGLRATAQRIRALDFNSVQLDLHFKDIDFGAGEIMRAKAREVRDVFRDDNLPICCISGYTNIIHPGLDERKRRGDYLKQIIRHGRDFGSAYVIFETGAFNTESGWAHHRKNKTEEGFETCRKVIADLAQTAYDHGAVILLETNVNNVVGSVEEAARMFAQVDHPGLGRLMNLTNYFETHNIDRMDQILNQVFDTLTDKTRIAHAEDVKRSGGDKSQKHADIGDADARESHTFRGVGEIELRAPGLGGLNYDLYLTDVPRQTMKELMRRSDQPAIRETILWVLLHLAAAAGEIYFWRTWTCVPLFRIYGVLHGSACDPLWHEGTERNAQGGLSPEEKDFIPASEPSKAAFAAHAPIAIYVATLLSAFAMRSFLPLMLIGGPRMYGC